METLFQSMHQPNVFNYFEGSIENTFMIEYVHQILDQKRLHRRYFSIPPPARQPVNILLFDALQDDGFYHSLKQDRVLIECPQSSCLNNG
jgi:hypothetical protein